MTRTYLVQVLSQGYDVLKLNDTIADARAWARVAFPHDIVNVQPATIRPLCECCGCRPCLYGTRD